MSKLAESGVACECGSFRLESPTAIVAEGSFCICATCGQSFQLQLLPRRVKWAVVERELESRPHDLYALRWHRNGVVKHLRRALSTTRTTPARERTRLALGVVLVILVGLKILRAVFS